MGGGLWVDAPRGISKATRLWSEARGIAVEVAEANCMIDSQPTNSKADYRKRKANTMGMQSDEFDVRVQGALNEPGIKLEQGIAMRISRATCMPLAAFLNPVKLRLVRVLLET